MGDELGIEGDNDNGDIEERDHEESELSTEKGRKGELGDKVDWLLERPNRGKWSPRTGASVTKLSATARVAAVWRTFCNIYKAR